MGRLCKCRICGKKLNVNDAYKVVKNKINMYYCNQEEYESWLLKKERQIELEKSIGNAIESTIGTIFNNGTWGEVRKTLAFLKQDDYSLEQIEEYLWAISDEIRHILVNKWFQNEFLKIKYYLAIIRNHIDEYFSEGKVDLLVGSPQVAAITYTTASTDFDMPPVKYKEKKKRRPLAEIECEDDEDGDDVMNV